MGDMRIWYFIIAPSVWRAESDCITTCHIYDKRKAAEKSKVLITHEICGEFSHVRGELRGVTKVWRLNTIKKTIITREIRRRRLYSLSMISSEYQPTSVLINRSGELKFYWRNWKKYFARIIADGSFSTTDIKDMSGHLALDSFEGDADKASYSARRKIAP